MLGSMSEDGYAWLLKLYAHRISISSLPFRLHCHVTSALFILCSLAVSTRELVGNPTECLPAENIPQSFTDTYCWIHPTYTVLEAFHGSVGVDVAHPGVSNTAGASNTTKKLYAYYQWICFVMFLMSILCYIPHSLWRSWEGRRMEILTAEACVASGKYEEGNGSSKAIAHYFNDCLHRQRAYALKYIFCELLSLTTVVFVGFLFNCLFDGDFLTYGSDVVWYSTRKPEELTNVADPMVFLFPRVTKCIFHTFGSSGDVQKYDVICLLPLNAFNEKIFLFLWYWLAALFTFLAMSVVFLLLFISSSRIAGCVLAMQCHMVPTENLDLFIKRTNFGDWFFLYSLSRNVDPTVMKSVFLEMVHSESDYDTGNKLI